MIKPRCRPTSRTLCARPSHLLRSAGLMAISIYVVGCTYLDDKGQPVGSTHVAVLSATPWDEYRDKLAPTFGFDAKAALNAVVPDTAQVEQTMLDAFRAKARIALAPSAVLDPGFGAAPGSSDDNPNRTAAGSSLPTFSLGDTLPGAPTAAPQAIDRAKLASEPFLQYLAATALFQEVRLLERYVTDAIQRDGYRAYIVRLQVTNMPYRRDVAFDTYANIAFFMDAIELPGTFKVLDRDAAFRRAAELVRQDRLREAYRVLKDVEAREQERRDESKPPAPPAEPTQRRQSAPATAQEDGNTGSSSDGHEAVPGYALMKTPGEHEAEMASDGGASGAYKEPDDARQAIQTALENQNERQAIAGIETADPSVKAPRQLPVVVPLLVTDQIEAASPLSVRRS
jgi:hypothetical protein